MENILKNPTFKKVVGIAAVAIGALMGASEVMTKQKEEKEKEELKARVADLESKIK